MTNKDEIKNELLLDDSLIGIKKLIKVVSPMLWMLIVGGVVIIVMTTIWLFKGTMASYVSSNGIYHPEASEYGEVLCFMPLSTGKMITEGMKVSCYPVGVNQQEVGHMNATVSYVEPYVTSVEEIKQMLKEDSLVNMYIQSGPVVMVICKLETDPSSKNGYKWTNEDGNDVVVEDGCFISVSITTRSETPYEYFVN